MNALIIVAHPDDEVIWIGGYIQRHRDFQWFAISACYGGDLGRSVAFAQSCRKLGIYNHHIFSYPDDHNQINDISLKADLKNVINGWVTAYGAFSIVFTHNKENGEYGHETHKKVGKVVCENVSEIFSSTPTLYQFNYKASFPENQQAVEMSDFERHENIRIEVAPTAASDSSKFLFLRHDELSKKLEILSTVYAAQRGDFRNLSWPCPNPEGFKEL